LVCGSSVTAVFFGFLIEETGSDIAVMGKFVFFLLFISAAHIVQFFSRTD
jgi:hypothetical protein